MDIFNDNDRQFLYDQAKAGQKKELFKNSLILGILLLCYNVFLEMSVYLYCYFYYFLKTRKFTLNFGVCKNYINDNLEKFSVTEFEMLGNAFVTFTSLLGILLLARFGFKIKTTQMLKCDKKGVAIGVKVFPFSLLLNYVFTMIISIITMLFANQGIIIPEADFSVDKTTFIAGFSMFIYMVVLAPIIEEIVYRGFILKLISPYGKTVSVILSAFIFGFMHGNLSQFVTAFVTGIVFSAVAVKTGSILPTIVMHMMNNAINFIAIVGEDYSLDVCLTVYSVLFTCILLVGVMEIFIFRGVIKQKPMETTLLSTKESVKTIILNPAILLYLGYLTYTFVKQIIEANM
ncbi:MAG: CPBP family intramembrane metalloprotease [Oscillospiraceae bacterium]|nr:CPBP family intramembrane metalloprotease [Oscillospiraceae bacterium]